jgi:hypothetical protein
MKISEFILIINLLAAVQAVDPVDIFSYGSTAYYVSQFAMNTTTQVFQDQQFNYLELQLFNDLPYELYFSKIKPNQGYGRINECFRQISAGNMGVVTQWNSDRLNSQSRKFDLAGSMVIQTEDKAAFTINWSYREDLATKEVVPFAFDILEGDKTHAFSYLSKSDNIQSQIRSAPADVTGNTFEVTSTISVSYWFPKELTLPLSVGIRFFPTPLLKHNAIVNIKSVFQNMELSWLYNPMSDSFALVKTNPSQFKLEEGIGSFKLFFKISWQDVNKDYYYMTSDMTEDKGLVLKKTTETEDESFYWRLETTSTSNIIYNIKSYKQEFLTHHCNSIQANLHTLPSGLEHLYDFSGCLAFIITPI